MAMFLFLRMSILEQNVSSDFSGGLAYMSFDCCLLYYYIFLIVLLPKLLCMIKPLLNGLMSDWVKRTSVLFLLD